MNCGVEASRGFWLAGELSPWLDVAVHEPLIAPRARSGTPISGFVAVDGIRAWVVRWTGTARRRPRPPGLLPVGYREDVRLPLGRPGRVAPVGPHGVLEAARLGESVVVADERARREERQVRVPRDGADVPVRPALAAVGVAHERLDQRVPRVVAVVVEDDVPAGLSRRGRDPREELVVRGRGAPVVLYADVLDVTPARTVVARALERDVRARARRVDIVLVDVAESLRGVVERERRRDRDPRELVR